MKTKIISIVLFLIFGLFAAWQYNDPDPLLWMAIYGAIAFISLLRAFGFYNRGVVIILMIAMGAYSLFYIPGLIDYLQAPDKGELFGKMIYDKPYIEETREFFGLVLGFLALLVHVRMK